MVLSWSAVRRLGRPGARRFRKASTPFPFNARFHREAVVRLTPNFRATWDCDSPVCRSCAANRRLLSISSRVRTPCAAVSTLLARFVECQSDNRIPENNRYANCFLQTPPVAYGFRARLAKEQGWGGAGIGRVST